MAKKLLVQLIESVLRNNFKAVLASLELGADPNGYEDKAKIRPLHIAAAHNAIKISQLLMLFGADPLAESDEGLTPIDIAIEHKYYELLAVLRLFQQASKKVH